MDSVSKETVLSLFISIDIIVTFNLKEIVSSSGNLKERGLFLPETAFVTLRKNIVAAFKEPSIFKVIVCSLIAEEEGLCLISPIKAKPLLITFEEKKLVGEQPLPRIKYGDEPGRILLFDPIILIDIPTK